MSIKVTCPGCLARFKVSSRFAGRSGLCPKCGATIRVPSKKEQVKVHAPGLFEHGGRGAGGRLILKPLEREPLRVSPTTIAAVLAGVLGVLVAAWLAGGLLQRYWMVRAAALVLVSPPLALAGYLLIRSEESLNRFTTRPLAARTAICAAAYALLWAVFGHASTFILSGEVWSWFLVAPPFIITGGLAALACYDLDFGAGCLHYAFYLLATILLRGVAGMGWIWLLGDRY